MKKLWMVDFAREQCPTYEHLATYADVAVRSGYDSLGLYLEHRYAFRCTPWAHGLGAITPEMVRRLQSDYPQLQIVPFVNLLGHFEGFLYTEEGKRYREELFNGLQACPSCPEFAALCQTMLDEVLQDFASPLVHIGGDETAQLARCPRCKDRAEGQLDQKEWLYAGHFGPLADHVRAKGRIPAVWGDMFLEHPKALEAMPPETVVFDWQYFGGVAETAPKFGAHPVYACPTIHIYNAPWMHIEGTEANVRDVARDAHNLGLEGFCLTLWEGGLFGAFDTLFPAVEWAAKVAGGPAFPQTLLESFGDSEWARLMGVDLEKLGGVFGFGKIRNGLKARLLLYSNPFLAWMHHGGQLAGLDGAAALVLCAQALSATDSESEKAATMFIRSAVEFIRMAEAARLEYIEERPDAAIGKLAPCRYLFDTLETYAQRNHTRIGGSLADVERCRAAKAHLEKVVQRVRKYGHRELGYLPAWEVITNPRFMPHDQGCWWLVNRWANE